ncbi:ERF family protein [Streptococcus anginosus]|uniref:ERF family protein n=2 Tax=Bacillati TaxID=1783272 RepID=A0ABT3EAL1_STRAP|nr:ERF family protein [Streptococcus anginosus]KAA9291755.1 single-stranded DNA-binding protein [Streptococcus anginosus]MCW1042494.1 ERF family protein [Streptococcus anginosus]
MADLTFAELQRQMQLAKKKTKDVKYAFRNAEDIYTTFKELKSDWSVIVTDELIELTGKIFVKATAVAINDERNEKYQSTAYAELSLVPVFNTQKGQIKQMQEPQWTGAVSSYARKYALQGLFAIGEKDVDDYPVDEDQAQAAQQNNQSPQGNNANQSDLIDNEQYKAVYGKVRTWAQLKNANFDQVANYVLQHYKIRDFHDIPTIHFDTVIDYLNGQIAKARGQNDFNNL